MSRKSPNISYFTATRSAALDYFGRVLGRAGELTQSGVAEITSAASRPGIALLTTDIFDTVVLRDASSETQRLAQACARAARVLGVDADVLTRLRWWVHQDAYRAVAVRKPTGDASLAAMCAMIAAQLGLDGSAAAELHRAEVDIDIAHLRPNRPLLAALERVAASGVRVVAVSDTYYDAADIERMLTEVVGRHPIAAVYVSSELRLTKHSGAIFDVVAARERMRPDQIVHIGDNGKADVDRAREAAWTAVHLPRPRQRWRRLAARAYAAPTIVRRAR